MSSKLIIEFHDGYLSTIPVARVLAFHGGEDPEAAAWTLAAFLAQIGRLSNTSELSACDLATRFIIWQHSLASDDALPQSLDVVLVKDTELLASQLARIHAGDRGPLVSIVKNEFTNSGEMEEAERILGASMMPPTPSPLPHSFAL